MDPLTLAPVVLALIGVGVAVLAKGTTMIITVKLDPESAALLKDLTGQLKELVSVIGAGGMTPDQVSAAQQQLADQAGRLHEMGKDAPPV